MMNHLIFSRFEPLVSNREIKIIHYDNSKMRLSIFSKMGKDPKKPKDDPTVEIFWVTEYCSEMNLNVG